MQPERDTPEGERSPAVQRTLADYIRDPECAPLPEGIEPRRLRIYQALFFNNIESMLAGNFPVIRRIFSSPPEPGRWTALVRDFYREHPSCTPLFTELAREFVRYVDHRVAAPGCADPPWLAELAHYEWLELALQISEARVDDIPHAPDGDLLDGRPLLSPLAWPQTYRWPVHRIAPDFQPDTPPPEPTCLLLQRDPEGKVRFQQLSALTFRLLQRLEQHPDLTGHIQLQELATEAGVANDASFIEQGRVMLQQLQASRVITGTRRGPQHPSATLPR